MYWEDFAVGHVAESSTRTITDTDIDNFAEISGDFNALHTDEAYAKSLGFPSRLAHGMLGLAVASGLIAQMGLLEGTAIAFLELNWKLVRPVLSGDTLTVRLEVTELRETKRDDRGVLIRDILVLNQSGETVQQGTQTLLIKRTEGQES